MKLEIDNVNVCTTTESELQASRERAAGVEAELRIARERAVMVEAHSIKMEMRRALRSRVSGCRC